MGHSSTQQDFQTILDRARSALCAVMSSIEVVWDFDDVGRDGSVILHPDVFNEANTAVRRLDEAFSYQMSPVDGLIRIQRPQIDNAQFALSLGARLGFVNPLEGTKRQGSLNLLND